MTAAAASASGGIATESFGWSFEPWIIVPLLLTAGLYAAGSRAMTKAGKADRSPYHSMFWTGLLLLALALMSPLHEYGEHLFSAHMIEHEILMVAAAPLLVAAQAGPVLLVGMPATVRNAMVAFIRSGSVQQGWRGATDLLSATVIHTAVLWVWHIPVAYQAAVANEGIHIVQHLSFIVSAILFWSAVLDRDRRRYEQGLAALALFFASLQASFLGALITFSNRLWYPAGVDPFPICGLDRGEDQALAGLIMWVPACTVYVVAALIILARWFGRLEARHG